MRVVPVIASVVPLLLPMSPGATAPVVEAKRPEIFRYSSAGADLLVALCAVRGTPAAVSTTSTCRVNDDNDSWLIVNGNYVFRTSPQTFTGTVATSQWISAIDPPYTVCSGGHAIFNEGLDKTIRVDATPVCTYLPAN